jgi:hypothetical protein
MGTVAVYPVAQHDEIILRCRPVELDAVLGHANGLNA